MSIAQDYCKRLWQADLRRHDGKSHEPETANIADNDEGRVGEERSETQTGPDQAETGPSTTASASVSQNEIRIDERARIFISDSRPVSRPSRTRFITSVLLLVFSCIGVLSWFYFVGPSQFLEHQSVSSSLVLGPEKASIPAATSTTGLTQDKIGNVALATASTIDHPIDSTKNLSQTPAPPPAATKPDTTSSDTATKKGQPKVGRKLVPVPETRPTTIEGWTVRNVVNGIATLEGPGVTWKAARGDTLPGLGKVESVVLWGNRWIVATTKGLISSP